MKACAHLQYLPEFIVERETFQINVTGKIKTRILYSTYIFPRKSCRLWGNVGKYGRAGQTTDDNIIAAWMRYTCWTNKAKNTHPEHALLIHDKKGYTNTPQSCLSIHYALNTMSFKHLETESLSGVCFWVVQCNPPWAIAIKSSEMPTQLDIYTFKAYRLRDAPPV